MPNLNRITIIGHLGQDPELKQVNDTSLTKLSIATSVNRKKKDGTWETIRTDWHHVSVWGSLAEVVVDKLKKGSAIEVEGRIKYDTYEKDGETKYFTEIKADRISIPLFRKSEQRQNDDMPQPEDDGDLPF